MRERERERELWIPVQLACLDYDSDDDVNNMSQSGRAIPKVNIEMLFSLFHSKGLHLWHDILGTFYKKKQMQNKTKNKQGKPT